MDYSAPPSDVRKPALHADKDLHLEIDFQVCVNLKLKSVFCPNQLLYYSKKYESILLNILYY